MDKYTARWAQGFAQGQKIAGETEYLGKRTKPQGLRAEDLVDPDGFGTGAADMFLVNTIGGERAGKAETMARSIGRNPSFAVTHPQVHSLGSALGGGVLGTALGGVTGALLGGLSGNAEAGATLGSVFGGLGGFLGGTVHSGRKRSHEIEDISRQFDNTDTINPNYRKANPLGLLGMTGAHSRGRTKALQAELGQQGVGEQSFPTKFSIGAGILGMPISAATGGASVAYPFQVAANAANMYRARRDRQEALQYESQHK